MATALILMVYEEKTFLEVKVNILYIYTVYVPTPTKVKAFSGAPRNFCSWFILLQGYNSVLDFATAWMKY